MRNLDGMVYYISILERSLSAPPKVCMTEGRSIIRYKQWTQDVEEEILEDYIPGEVYEDTSERDSAKVSLFNNYESSDWYSERYYAGKVLVRNKFIGQEELERNYDSWIDSLKEAIMKKDKPSLNSLCDLRYMLRYYDWNQDKSNMMEFMRHYLASMATDMGFFRRRAVRSVLRNEYIKGCLPVKEYIKGCLPEEMVSMIRQYI